MSFDRRKSDAKYARSHRGAKNQLNREYRKRLKEAAIVAYGGKCECGAAENLEFDHINGNGNGHRHAIFGYGHASPGGWNFYLWLKKQGYPKSLGLQLICEACHSKKHPSRPRANKRHGSPAMQNPDEYKQELLKGVPF